MLAYSVDSSGADCKSVVFDSVGATPSASTILCPSSTIDSATGYEPVRCGCNSYGGRQLSPCGGMEDTLVLETSALKSVRVRVPPRRPWKFGRVWLIAPVLKTDDRKRSVGSNPTASSILWCSLMVERAIYNCLVRVQFPPPRPIFTLIV